jgi:hypothetical protein
VSNHADRIRLIAIETLKGALSETKAPFALSGHRWPELGFFAKKRKHFFDERVGCDAVLLP